MDFKLDPITGFTWIQWNSIYFLVDHGRLHFQIQDSVFESGPMNAPLKIPEDLNFILLSTYESAAWFIHNYASTLVQHGLPLSTHILATKPTLELARICLKEGSQYPCPTYEKACKILETRMVDMMFGQTWHLDAVTLIRCLSSGYILGSCNWVVVHGNHSIGILGPSSIHPERYFKPLEVDALSNCTVLLLTSMAMESHLDWESICIQFQSHLYQLFIEKKSVLIPQTISKIGYWDTFHILFQFFMNHPAFQREWHWVVISKESAKTVAYANSALAYLSVWGQNMVAQMQMPVFFLGHPKLPDLKFHMLPSISDPALGHVYLQQKLILSKPHAFLKGLHTCGTGVAEKFPLDPRMRFADVKSILDKIHPQTIVTMGAVPESWAQFVSEYRWVNALNQPVHQDAPWIPVNLSPEWLEYEKTVPEYLWRGVPMKKVLIQWNLTTNTIHPVVSSKDLSSAKALVRESRYVGPFSFQTLIERLVKKGAPTNVTVDGNMATFPNIPCQIFYNSADSEIEVAFDKTDNADFRFLIEACMKEIMLELSV